MVTVRVTEFVDVLLDVNFHAGDRLLGSILFCTEEELKKKYITVAPSSNHCNMGT